MTVDTSFRAAKPRKTPAMKSLDQAAWTDRGQGKGYPAGSASSRRHPEGTELRRAWVELAPFRPDARLLERNRIMTTGRTDHRHMPVDILRTKVIQTMREKNWSTLVVTSPSAGCGKTTLALNLAFSLAREADVRLGILDFDLRQPGIARLLGMTQSYVIEKFLRREAPTSESLVRHDRNLAIAPNTKAVVRAAELLQELVYSPLLAETRRRLGLDILILDMPPMLANDDVIAILPAVDSVLLVAAAEHSSFNEVDVCERGLTDAGKLLGVVLNKCRYDPRKYGY
jgi:Mrp family chromosome partitioning ATPase